MKRFKTILTFFVLCSVIFAGYQQAMGAAAAFSIVPEQIIVKLQAGASLATVNQVYQTQLVAELVPGQDVYLLQLPAGSDVDMVLAQMATDAHLLYAEPNLVAQSPEAVRSSAWVWGGQVAEPYGEQYALDSIQLLGSHDYSSGAEIIVAVIDTGVQSDHPLLAGRLTAVQMDFIDGDNHAYDEGNGVDDDGDGDIDEAVGHGTHVAGVALLVAPNAQIMPIRVLDSDGTGNIFAIAEAIFFAVEHGARVINLSLGTTEESEMLEEVLEEAAEAGVFVVAAAGNLATTQKMYPAADECVLAVTAVDSADSKATFANYGRWIDLAAPGDAIYSLFPTDGYAWWSGTSMAAPFVAGQATLLLAYEPSLNVVEVSQLLGATASPLSLVDSRGRSLVGAGKMNVLASLQALVNDQIPDGRELLDDDCADD